MADVAYEQGWVRNQEAPTLPPPPNTTGVKGWILANLFPSLGSGVLTVLGLLFILWFAWGVVSWALIDATFTGSDRGACVEGQGQRALGACWPYVWAKFHQFVYGFYPFDQRWRVNICFLLGLTGLVPMLVPTLPYKTWNALFLLVLYPLVTLILLTGGNFDISMGTFLFCAGLILLAAALLPLAAFGMGDGAGFNRVGLILAGLGVLLAIASWVVDVSPIAFVGLRIGVLGLAALIVLIGAALTGLAVAVRDRTLAARSAVKAWGLGAAGVLATLVILAADFGLEPVETQQWGGLLVTLVVAVTGIVASLPLGILLALGRRSRLPIIRLFSIVFIEVWRGVPLITVLFMASVMLPLFMPVGVNFDKLLRALIGTALFSSAYMAEVVRGGLQAIPKGQYEAAQALGLSYWRMMSLIILPQALKIVIPGIVNTFIGLFKDTTLVAIIGLFDLLGIVNASFADAKWASPETGPTGYFVAALIFWVFCFGMSRYSMFMERRLATGHRR